MNRPTVECECGETTHVPCAWHGPIEDTTIVDWMPSWLRASHDAAGHSGLWPQNGAVRLRVQMDCAQRLLDSEEEARWCVVRDRDDA